MSELQKIYSISDLVSATGISRQNIMLLLDQFPEAVPTLMDGERRKYPPEAIRAIRRLWRHYNSGVEHAEETEPNEWTENALAGLARAKEMFSGAAVILRDLETEFRKHRPRRLYYINSLPSVDFELTKPVAVMVEVIGRRFVARLDEVNLEAEGKSANMAVVALREEMVRAFKSLSREESLSDEESNEIATLSSLIRRKSEKKQRA